MAASTLLRVAALTRGLPRTTSEAVALETPAFAATWRSVGRFIPLYAGDHRSLNQPFLDQPFLDRSI
jgi:hypothetical protein